MSVRLVCLLALTAAVAGCADTTPAGGDPPPGTAGQPGDMVGSVGKDACADVVWDDDAQYLRFDRNAGSAFSEQRVSGRYHVLQDIFERTGFSVSKEAGTDFCTVQEEYPCSWDGFNRKATVDPGAAAFEYQVYFGFVNAPRDPEIENIQADTRDFHLRAWGETADGTVYLTPTGEIGGRGVIQVKAHVQSNDPVEFCDVVQAGLWD